MTGRSVALLSYDAVLRRVRPTGSSEVGLRDIPLEAIAGGVGRLLDVTRDFLPHRDSDEERWSRVRTAVTDPARAGLPPIQDCQIGGAYFVIDGHHRLTVARQMGAKDIPAYVTEVSTKVPLSADVRPEDHVLVTEYSEYLEHTQLDQTGPDADLRDSAPGASRHLDEKIRLYQQQLDESRGSPVPLEAAAAEWYDNSFLPVIGAIRELGLVRDFPD